MTARRFLLRTIVTGACLTAAVAILVLLSGSLDGTSGRVLLTTTAISIFSVLAVPAQMLLDRGSLPLLARVSAGLTGTAFGITVVLITHEVDIAEYGTRTVTFRDGQVVKDIAITRRRNAQDELAALPTAEAV